MLNKMRINVVIYYIVVRFEYLHVWTPRKLQISAETCSSNKRVYFLLIRCTYLHTYLLTYLLSVTKGYTFVLIRCTYLLTYLQ